MASSNGHGRRQPDGAGRECETGAQCASRPGTGVLWPLEPATAAKHRLYKRYLGHLCYADFDSCPEFWGGVMS